MKLRYTGAYNGCVVLTGHNVKPGDVIEVDEAAGEKLLLSGQFERVVVAEPTGGE